MHPFVHRRRVDERPADPRLDERPSRGFDEEPELPPFWARNLLPEVLEAFREAKHGRT